MEEAYLDSKYGIPKAWTSKERTCPKHPLMLPRTHASLSVAQVRGDDHRPLLSDAHLPETHVHSQHNLSGSQDNVICFA